MNKIFVVANWKCNPTTQKEAGRLFRIVSNVASRAKKVEIVVCPPFVDLSGKFKVSNFKLGAQDCFWQEKGAFTGEVSVNMLKNTGCEYVIVGHSERRRYFGETNETVNKKIKAAISASLRPILCVGETKDEKEKGEMATILEEQIEAALKGIKTKEIRKTIIAYEPVWAIGTGKNCAPGDAESAGLFIKKIVAKRYSRVIADNAPILYGGSVNSQNAASYIKDAGLQGLLVGGASLDAVEFTRIVAAVK